MEITEPLKIGFTIYSKSGCTNCDAVKELLKENSFLFKAIDCDVYLLKNREGFLQFIENKAETSYKTFPMVFYDGKFVGGLAHTMAFIDKLLLSFVDNF